MGLEDHDSLDILNTKVFFVLLKYRFVRKCLSTSQYHVGRICYELCDESTTILVVWTIGKVRMAIPMHAALAYMWWVDPFLVLFRTSQDMVITLCSRVILSKHVHNGCSQYNIHNGLTLCGWKYAHSRNKPGRFVENLPVDHITLWSVCNPSSVGSVS